MWQSTRGSQFLSLRRAPVAEWVPEDGRREPSNRAYPMLRSRASGPEIGFPGRISAGFLSGEPENRLSARFSASRRTGFQVFLFENRPKSSQEARFPTRKHYCRRNSKTRCRLDWRNWPLCVYSGVTNGRAPGYPKFVVFGSGCLPWMICCTQCHAIVLPARKSVFRAGSRPNSNRERLKIGPPAGFRPAGGPILRSSRLESDRNRSGSPMFNPAQTWSQNLALVLLFWSYERSVARPS
jgi:hypothetical protein